MVNYYGVFIKDMRQLRVPLDALLKKNIPFKWSPDCQDAFEKAKKVLASPLLLTHFDPSLELIVAADASDYGSGAVIMHRFADGTEKAISHARRNLTDAEKKYGQIEKEGLALVYAVRKFHRYLSGRHFTPLTNHISCFLLYSGARRAFPLTVQIDFCADPPYYAATTSQLSTARPITLDKQTLCRGLSQSKRHPRKMS
ncbi:hypothetical protein ANCDUO_12430 [Ancylostoma duodenale]|uniref:RNA-directed DNA polymerase n=1 Tax=Ancylostoma duodenale TaxID=51022 RepID=A0A0C2GES5_9BILA|nr:hypothetical protein ANCDUO_12430 [Ancylostoma duodenale]